MRRRALNLGLSGVAVLVVAMNIQRLAFTPPETDAQNEDAALVREVAERLFASSYAGTMLGERAEARLLVGQLPSDFPFAFPLPPGARVVGSVERTVGDRRTGIEVVIEASGTPASILSFYDRALPQEGWYVPGGVMSAGGFQPAAGKRLDMYCMAEDGPWLTMTVSERDPGLNDVRLSVSSALVTEEADPRFRGPCSTQPFSQPAANSAGRLLPRLSGPPGVQLQGSSLGYGPDGTSSAIAVTSMSVGELANVFAPQLEEAGWARTRGGADGPLAWSTWSLPEGSDWQGFMHVVEVPGENRRQLTVQVQSATSPPNPGMLYYPMMP